MVAISHAHQDMGVNMRKSHEKVARAFLGGGPAHSGNLVTDGEELWLFGNAVAHRRDEVVEVTWAGWVTSTTAAVLSALAECAGAKLRFGRVDGEPTVYNTEDGTRWRVDSRQWLELV